MKYATRIGDAVVLHITQRLLLEYGTMHHDSQLLVWHQFQHLICKRTLKRGPRKILFLSYAVNPERDDFPLFWKKCFCQTPHLLPPPCGYAQVVRRVDLACTATRCAPVKMAPIALLLMVIVHALLDGPATNVIHVSLIHFQTANFSVFLFLSDKAQQKCHLEMLVL